MSTFQAFEREMFVYVYNGKWRLYHLPYARHYYTCFGWSDKRLNLHQIILGLSNQGRLDGLSMWHAWKDEMVAKSEGKRQFGRPDCKQIDRMAWNIHTYRYLLPVDIVHCTKNSTVDIEHLETSSHLFKVTCITVFCRWSQISVFLHLSILSKSCSQGDYAIVITVCCPERREQKGVLCYLHTNARNGIAISCLLRTCLMIYRWRNHPAFVYRANLNFKWNDSKI